MQDSSSCTSLIFRELNPTWNTPLMSNNRLRILAISEGQKGIPSIALHVRILVWGWILWLTSLDPPIANQKPGIDDAVKKEQRPRIHFNLVGPPGRRKTLTIEARYPSTSGDCIK